MHQNSASQRMSESESGLRNRVDFMYVKSFLLFIFGERGTTVPAWGLWSTPWGSSFLQSNIHTWFLKYPLFFVFLTNLYGTLRGSGGVLALSSSNGEPVNLFTKGSSRLPDVTLCVVLFWNTSEVHILNGHNEHSLCSSLAIRVSVFACFCYKTCLLAETWTCPELQLKQQQSFMVI